MQKEILETSDITEYRLTPGYVKIGTLPDGREIGYFPTDPRSKMIGDQFDEKLIVEISLA